MSDINEAMGYTTAADPPPEVISEPQKPTKPKRVRPSRAKPKPSTEPESVTPPPRPARPAAPPKPAAAPARIRAGQRCPQCDRGLIGVVRTRLYRAKNKRVVILGCRATPCLWDLDGDNVRATPINPGRPMQE
jgi:hypothetical protein